MSKNIFGGVGLTVALGIGTAYAVHEAGELNARANRIEACVEYYDTHELRIDECPTGPLGQAEANTLRGTARTTGALGWLAFFGTLSSGSATLEQMRNSKAD